MPGAGGADEDSIAATEESEGSLAAVAQLLHGRHHAAQLPARAEGAVRDRHPALRAQTAPAAQDRDGILEEIQADSAGGFLLDVSDGVSRGHGCLQAVLGEARSERAGPGYCWKRRAEPPEPRQPQRVRHSQRPGQETAPGKPPAGIHGQEGAQAAAAGALERRDIYKANSFPSGCTRGSKVRPEGGSRRQGVKQECGK